MTALATTAGYDRRRHGTHLLSTPDVIADPSGYTRAVRELGSVWWDKVGSVWVCTGYREASAILRDHARFRSGRVHARRTLRGRRMNRVADLADLVAAQMLFLDPPTHTAIRDSMRKAFAPAGVAAREQQVAATVGGLLADLPDTGAGVDVVAAFTGPLPTRLIASRLGLPEAHPQLPVWSDAYETLLGSLSSLPDVRDRSIVKPLLDAFASLRDLAAERRGGTGDDLITLLANGLAGPELTGAALDAALDSVAANSIVLLGGGYQTLTQLITMSLVRLAQHPDQLAALRLDPTLVDAVVDETMRLDGSSQYVARQATETVELGGVRIKAGQSILVLLAAANHDPAQFADPDSFDIYREGSGRHLGFGVGRHHCAGNLDAEQATRIALLAFLDRYPAYGLADRSDAITWGRHANTRCPEQVLLDLGRPVTIPRQRRPEPEPATAARYGPAELRALRAHNELPVDLTGEPMWMETIRQIAADTPDAPALQSATETLTYAELDHAADVLATQLRQVGVEPGVAVAILMDRTAAAYVAALAVGRAGGAFLAADTACPEGRLRAMLATARAAVVCTQPHLADWAAGLKSDATVLPVEAAHLLAVPRPVPVLAGVNPGHDAYLVFTSGSTGAPKAIAIDHRALINLQVADRQVFRLGRHDRVLQWFSPNFDGFPFDVILGLTAGACLVLAPPAAACVGPTLYRTLRDFEITAATLTPSAWQTITSASLPRLRVANTAGEVCTAATVALLSAPGRRVFNLYGPAEAAVWSTWQQCHPDGGDPPIGVPVLNRRAYLLDDDRRPVADGTPGQLWLAGTGVGRYVRQPALMQARFAPDPLATGPGQLMYATGDRCLRQPDGTLVYLGRIDRQLKIRGTRIEPEEIERVLMSYPGITHASIDVDDGQLVATVVAADPAAFAEPALRAHLRANLHSAMIPTRVHLVGTAALTLTGKLDLHADQPSQPSTTPLPAPAPRPASGPLPVSAPLPAPAQPTAPVRPPAGPVDPDARTVWEVAQMFATVVEVHQRTVRVDTEFFDLDGGDSLALAELLARIEERHGVLLDPDAVIAEPTPDAIARLVDVARVG